MLGSIYKLSYLTKLYSKVKKIKYIICEWTLDVRRGRYFCRLRCRWRVRGRSRRLLRVRRSVYRYNNNNLLPRIMRSKLMKMMTIMRMLRMKKLMVCQIRIWRMISMMNMTMKMLVKMIKRKSRRRKQHKNSNNKWSRNLRSWRERRNTNPNRNPIKKFGSMMGWRMSF